MGGIGKTELALQYAIAQFRQEQYPGGICWLRARGQEIATQIVTFAQTKIGLTLPDGLDEKGQVDYSWGHWREGDVLVVLDDVSEFDAVEPYLPPSDPKFKVLLTTRLNLGSSVQSLSIEELDDKSALALLETLVGSDRIQSQLEDAKTLYDWVGNLPLGLELLGRYLANDLDLSIHDLLQELKSMRLDTEALLEKEDGMTAQLGVVDALELSWKNLEDPEKELACLLGMFAIAPIPWQYIESCLPNTPPRELTRARKKGLRKRNLLKRVEQSTYQLHQIVQEFFRIKLNERTDKGESVKAAYCTAMVGVAQGINDSPTIDVIAGMRASIPHLEELTRQWIDLSDDDLTWPYVGIGRFYKGQGNYGLALPWYQKCLEQTQQRFGNEHPSVATSLNNLAGLYENQGRYTEAEPLYVQTLEMTQKLLGNEHPDVASSLNNLAGLYKNQGRYTEAEPLYVQALEMKKKLLGNEHPDVANSMWCLGALYQKQGRNEDAEGLYRKALVIFEEKLGSSHPHTQRLRNYLASLS
ncbi:tetratricopeptide repeat protein (plasmid) [Acaryochloris sp. 'Moss Beach']|nr:tetratricopeptide repeat protein [Acaryochloris sp. 'Moss Beach']